MTEKLTFEELLEQDGQIAYTNKGVSMMPLLRQSRDVMLISKKGQAGCKKLDAVLFRRPGPKGPDAYVMHRILRVNGDGTYWIVGDNCMSGETVREEQILGVLTGVVRSGKTIATDDWRYRLYVNTWCRCYPVRFALKRARAFAGGCLRRLRARGGQK